MKVLAFIGYTLVWLFIGIPVVIAVGVLLLVLGILALGLLV